MELELNRSVLNTLSLESEKETTIQRSQVQWFNGLSKDRTFKERAKWRDGILELPAWRRRAGQNRSYSKKPSKDQRKRIRLMSQERSAVGL